MRFPQGWQLVILLIVIIVVFGAARLPNAARSLCKSLKIFKKEVQDLRDNDDDGKADDDGNADDDDAGSPNGDDHRPGAGAGARVGRCVLLLKSAARGGAAPRVRGGRPQGW